jgi:hypothetical protein
MSCRAPSRSARTDRRVHGGSRANSAVQATCTTRADAPAARNFSAHSCTSANGGARRGTPHLLLPPADQPEAPPGLVQVDDLQLVARPGRDLLHRALLPFCRRARPKFGAALNGESGLDRHREGSRGSDRSRVSVRHGRDVGSTGADETEGARSGRGAWLRDVGVLLETVALGADLRAEARAHGASECGPRVDPVFAAGKRFGQRGLRGSEIDLYFVPGPPEACAVRECGENHAVCSILRLRTDGGHSSLGASVSDTGRCAPPAFRTGATPKRTAEQGYGRRAVSSSQSP